MSMEAPALLERVLDLEGVDELAVDLGTLCPRPPSQTITLTLRLAGLLPGRPAAITLSLYELEGEELRPLAARTLEVDAQPLGGQVPLPPVRFSLPCHIKSHRLLIRAESSYLGRCGACALPLDT